SAHTVDPTPDLPPGPLPFPPPLPPPRLRPTFSGAFAFLAATRGPRQNQRSMGNRAGARLSARRAGEFNTFRPIIVRCQALTLGELSRDLHSTQQRTWQARFVALRTAAVCSLSRGTNFRSASSKLRC